MMGNEKASPPAFPYQDATLSTTQRTEDLLSRMTLADKAGLLFHTMAFVENPTGIVQNFDLPPIEEMILNQRMNHFNVVGQISDRAEFVAWHNAIQEMAASLPLGIPITFSTDPRHSFTDNPGAAMLAGPFSQWPEPLGLAAIGSAERVERFGDIARQEYTAIGLRVALHPQIDLATEPRWARASGTFGQDADLTSRLLVGYIRGFQGERLGPESVATMVKHFPGGGPQKDGEDPHFEYGKEQVYPGGQFEYHLRPFEQAIRAGGSQMMPYYGMPIGTQYEEVGFGFNKSIITGLLRDRFGFDGIVCTDWGLLTDTELFGAPFPARAWGVEHLSRKDRMIKALDAGVDQFGGESCTELLVEVVRTGAVVEKRLDSSVRRLLREKFVLGLFDDPYRDEERARVVVGSEEFMAAGAAAQRDSLTLLSNREVNGTPTLPLLSGTRLYIEGVLPETAAVFGTIVANSKDADFAILRLKAPYEQRNSGLEAFFHAGSLEFSDEEVSRIQSILATVPTVIDIFLDRPAILTPFVDSAAAIIANFGCSDDMLFEVLFGNSEPIGSLPIELPASMAAVEASREDVPSDTAEPLFHFGHGLRYT